MSTVCGICNQNEAKYRCPRCTTHYCSIGCFKSESHTKLHDSQPDTVKVPASSNAQAPQENAPDAFQKIAKDPVIRGMLKEDALQFHLHTLLQIMNEPSITSNNRSGGQGNSSKNNGMSGASTEDRRSIMNMKLGDLRVGGIEENSLVEEFVDRVLELHSQPT